MVAQRSERVAPTEAERFYGHVDVKKVNGIEHPVWVGRTVPAPGTLANPTDDDRYGIFTMDGRHDIHAHRWAWEHNGGSRRTVPAGHRLFRIDKSCPKTCVEPSHWEPRPYGKTAKSPIDEVIALAAARGAKLTPEDVATMRRQLGATG